MLFFSDEMKRGMSDEKAMGERGDMDKWCPLQVRIPEGQWGKEGNPLYIGGKNVETGEKVVRESYFDSAEEGRDDINTQMKGR